MKPINNAWLRLVDAMFCSEISEFSERTERIAHSRCISSTIPDMIFLRSRLSCTKSRIAFLFIASGRQVHKGLDLVLEAFARRPHLELFVCSLFAEEGDFCSTIIELYQTSNIHAVGPVDIGDRIFRQIADRCSFSICRRVQKRTPDPCSWPSPQA